MGQLSQRFRNGWRPKQPRQARKGPLKKIVSTLEYSDNLMIQNRVKLECGHTVYSNGMHQARCDECATTNPYEHEMKWTHNPTSTQCESCVWNRHHNAS